MKWILWFPSLRGGNKVTEWFGSLLTVMQVISGGDCNQIQAVLPLILYSSTMYVPSPAREAKRLNSQLWYPAQTYRGSNFYKAPDPGPCASHVLYHVILTIIYTLTPILLLKKQAQRSSGDTASQWHSQALWALKSSFALWPPVLRSGLGGDEAHAVISWAKKWMGWPKRTRGTEARPKHPSLHLNNWAIGGLKIVTLPSGVASQHAWELWGRYLFLCVFKDNTLWSTLLLFC